MAFVKMVRDFPEVAGGKTTANVPEEAVNLAMDNGWRLADKKSETSKVESKAEEKVASKVEDKVEENKSESKTEAVKRTSKRDA
jgi:hypothetical protein